MGVFTNATSATLSFEGCAGKGENVFKLLLLVLAVLAVLVLALIALALMGVAALLQEMLKKPRIVNNNYKGDDNG
jgi:hypothetical protein